MTFGTAGRTLVQVASCRSRFNHGERGKFCRKDGDVQLPVYLEADELHYLQARAKDKNIDLNELVDQLLKRDIALIARAVRCLDDARVLRHRLWCPRGSAQF